MQRIKGDAMKDVPKKQLPEIAGGDQALAGPDPQLPKLPGSVDFPRNPFGPVYEAPLNDEDWQDPR
jgi:hypothetical protein